MLGSPSGGTFADIGPVPYLHTAVVPFATVGNDAIDGGPFNEDDIAQVTGLFQHLEYVDEEDETPLPQSLD